MDEYGVKLTSRALRDLDSIYTYVAEQLLEPGTAQKLADKLAAEILSLGQMPYRCAERQRGVYVGKGYRQLFVESYTVIFRVDEKKKQVVIVAIRYSKSRF